jgi:hypothetical protein
VDCCKLRQYFKAMRAKYFVSGLLLLLSVGACKRSLEKYGEDFASIMKNDDGLFRGVNIGDTQDQVQQTERAAPASFTENVLTYEGQINETSEYAIRYGFENGSLFEIIVDATFEDTDDGVKVIKGFKEFFTERYGMFKLGSGFCVWDVKTNVADVHIELVDDGEYASFGQFSLNFHKQNDPEIQNLQQ